MSRTILRPVWYPLFTLIVAGMAADVLYRNWGWWRRYGGDDDTVLLCIGLLGGAFGALLLWLLMMCAASCLSSFMGSHAVKERRVCWRGAMVSLRGADGVAGSIAGGIFLLSGHVESEQFYNYYTSWSDGAFHPGKWRASSNTRIFEEDRKDGEAVQWKDYFAHKWMYWFGELDGDLGMDFHIPKGSLKQSFAL